MPAIGPAIGIGTSLIGGLLGRKDKRSQPGQVDMTTTTQGTKSGTQTETPNVAPWLSDFIQNTIANGSPFLKEQRSRIYEGTGQLFNSMLGTARGSLSRSGFGAAPSGMETALSSEAIHRAGQSGVNAMRDLDVEEWKSRLGLVTSALPFFTGKTTQTDETTNETQKQQGYNNSAGVTPPSNPWADALIGAGNMVGGLFKGGTGQSGPVFSGTGTTGGSQTDRYPKLFP